MGPGERLAERQEGRPVAVVDEVVHRRLERRLGDHRPEAVDRHRPGGEAGGELPPRDEAVLVLGHGAPPGLRREHDRDVLEVPSLKVRAHDRSSGERSGVERPAVPLHEGGVDRRLEHRGALLRRRGAEDLGAVRGPLEDLRDLVDVLRRDEAVEGLLREELGKVGLQAAERARVGGGAHPPVPAPGRARGGRPHGAGAAPRRRGRVAGSRPRIRRSTRRPWGSARRRTPCRRAT